MSIKQQVLGMVLSLITVASAHAQLTPDQVRQALAAGRAVTNPQNRTVMPLDPGAPVNITMSRGSIDIVGGPGNSVTWELKTLRHDSLVAVNSDAWNRGLTYDGSLRIDVTPPADAGLGQLTLLVTVPRALKLLHVRLTAGNISVKGVDGDVVVENDSGAVAGGQLGGGVVMETREGGIDVEVSTVSPKHAMSLLARNGGVRLTVPANGAPQLSLSLGCKYANGGFKAMDRRDEFKALETMGVKAIGSGCDATTDRAVNGAQVKQVGQQMLDATWLDGGAAISLRTLRGGIIVRRR